jgi:hypothetical protein
MLVITGGLVHLVSAARGELRDIVVSSPPRRDNVGDEIAFEPMPKSSTPAAA